MNTGNCERLTSVALYQLQLYCMLVKLRLKTKCGTNVIHLKQFMSQKNDCFIRFKVVEEYL